MRFTWRHSYNGSSYPEGNFVRGVRIAARQPTRATPASGVHHAQRAQPADRCTTAGAGRYDVVTLKAEVEKVPCQQQDTGQSVLRQGVFARLKADGESFGTFYGFAERECVNNPQPGYREMKRQRSDDPGDRDHRHRMTPLSLFEGLVDA
eukprot:gene15513-biopygen20191